MQACGVSLFRLMRPIALLAVLATAATAYEMIVALPDANQTFREITFNVVASRAESDVKPRVFFTNFPNRVLYVRDIAAGRRLARRVPRRRDAAGSDDGVLRAAGAAGDRPRQAQGQLVLEHGTVHTTYPEQARGVRRRAPSSSRCSTSTPTTVFPRTQIIKGDNEMTIAELRADGRRERQARRRSTTASSTRSSRSSRFRRRASSWR